MTIAEKIKKIRHLCENAPNGTICDADTILTDEIENFVNCAEFEESGMAEDLFSLYEKCSDKELFKEMFFAFVNISFEDYLNECIDKTTRTEDAEMNDFLTRFHLNEKSSACVNEVFTSGCCFWFAKILQERFEKYGAKIVFCPSISHFACRINDSIYDITGRLSYIDDEEWYEWDKYKEIDPAHYERLLRDCVNF